jgi:FkbM family methyltransferase
VETVEYDTLAAKEVLGVPRVVKMDVEGHEFAALKGMKGDFIEAGVRCTVLRNSSVHVARRR